MIHTPDQNETDFTKGLRVMAKTLEKCNKIDAVSITLDRT